MKIKYFSISIVIGLFLSVTGSSFAFLNTAKISVHVIDESGKPVEGATVGIGFEDNSQRREKHAGGFTDSDGRFTASESCNGYIGYNAVKTGYYKSYGEYVYNNKGMLRWEPWNPEVPIVLRKIVNPVSMYAWNSNNNGFEIPVAGKDVGFDLTKHDWVKPYGQGVVSDFIFNLTVIENSNIDFEYKLTLTFSNKYDGIQSIEERLDNNSLYLLPRLAPMGGYNKEAIFFRKGLKRGGAGSWKNTHHHIFRIRSEEEHGKFKRAMYGKIISDIGISNPSKRGRLPGVEFKYYLNPDYSNNLEYDPKQNLLKLPDYKKIGVQ